MAVAHVQSTGAFTNAAGTTQAKAYASNVTAGNLLVIGCIWQSTTATCTVSGSVNGAAAAIGASLASNSQRAELFYVQNCSAGAETFTMTISGSVNSREIYIAEYSGADTAAALDASNALTGTSTNPSGSLTVVAASSMIAAVCFGAVGTVSGGAGFNDRVPQNGDDYEDKLGVSSGANTVAFVNASSGAWAIATASFQPATGGGAATVVKQLAALGAG